MTSIRAGAGFWFYQVQTVDELYVASHRPATPFRALAVDNAEVRDGDVLFLWNAGKQPGLFGWGVATTLRRGVKQSIGTPEAANEEMRPATGFSPNFNAPNISAIAIQVQLRLSQVISARELGSAPGLSDAPLIRQIQTGSYFRLSAEQAFEVCEALRSANFPAPDIAVADVLEPIARRVSRELAGVRTLLPDLLTPDDAQRIGAQNAATTERLSSGGLLSAYEPLQGLIDALGSVASSAQGEKASLLAPLSAARTRLMNDVFQIARLTDASERAKATLEAVRNTDDEWAFPTGSAKGDASTAAEPAREPSTESSAPAPASQPPPSQPTPASQTTPAPRPPVVEPAPMQPGKVAPPLAPAAPPLLLQAPKDPLFRQWEQNDLIGIGAAVNNLARYISHEGLLPPVAIGVFGDWGSGKSFFIRALQSQIALLSSQSRDALAVNKTTVFCSHVVQIEFNAWHFVESNLWASLAAHIFERLYAELERRGENEGSNRNIDGLYQQFSAYQQAVAEKERLSKLVDSLAKKRDQAQTNKATAEKSIKTRLLALTDVLKANIKALATQKLNVAERKRLADLLSAGNFEELDAASEEAVEIAREGQGLLGRMKVQLSWWGGWQLAFFAIFVGVVIFGLPLVLPWILGTQADNLQKVVTLFGGYAATAVVALGWLARSGRKLVAAARKVEGVLKEAREQVESAPDSQLDGAKRDLAAAQEELALIDQQVADQRNRLAQLADELDPNQLGTRLQEFLEARVKSDAYQKHLGLISLVRKDFSSLYELMQKYWQQRKRPVPEVLAEVRNALGEAAQTQVPFIERIVLYIDDLDRCPEDKVVEVLQAVHLMLGLPLFVVVVAVDVRWIGESIRKHYGKLVGWDEENQKSSIDLASASADDYLEKIFQIPYRIHPMEPDVRKLLLGGLLRQPYLAASGVTANPASPIVQQELVPKELSLYPEEQKTIEDLYGAVGSSPRRIRRFLDVYRLMRAGMEEGDVQELISKRHYVVLLALFAMLSGAPRTAPRVIELLRREALRLPADPEGMPFEQQALATWYAPALTQLQRDGVERPADELEVVGNAMRYIDSLNLTRPDLLAILRRWIPEIARYSFREVRMQRL